VGAEPAVDERDEILVNMVAIKPAGNLSTG
jgi:hypothetical protein